MKDKEFFYKLGVMCGQTLYTTFKFDNFKDLCNELTHIKEKYGWDMGLCSFVIQAYNDNSYDFQKSCFMQERFNVNHWNSQLGKELKDKIEMEYKGFQNEK